MKNLLTATLPALGLLALGGCATSGALTSTTESDGVYYSSADKTTASASMQAVYNNRSTAGAANPDGYAYGAPAPTSTPAPASTDENANPDYYQGSTAPAVNSGIQGANGDYYVSNSYNPSSFGVPYTGPGVSYVNYAPATTVAYASPWAYGPGFGYGFGSPYYGGFYSPYAYSAFYDPFYSPWGWGYGSRFSIGFGFGYGGGWGYPYGSYYGSPWGRGFGYYGDPYYGYGYGGYGGGYYGVTSYRSLGSARPGVYTFGDGGTVRVGPRGNRGTMMPAGTNGLAPNGNAPVTIGNGRRGGGYVMNGGGLAPTTSPGQPAADAYSGNANGGGQRGWRDGNQPTQISSGMSPGVETRNNPGAMSNPGAANGAGRRGFFSGFFGNGSAQPTRSEAGGGMPASPRPAYSQQPGRSFEAPRPSRSFDQQQQPSRSFDQPRYNPNPAPSRGFGGGGFGGSGGGGSFGGGGGGGRRGGR